MVRKSFPPEQVTLALKYRKGIFSRHDVKRLNTPVFLVRENKKIK